MLAGPGLARPTKGGLVNYLESTKFGRARQVSVCPRKASHVSRNMKRIACVGMYVCVCVCVRVYVCRANKGGGSKGKYPPTGIRKGGHPIFFFRVPEAQQRRQASKG